MWTPGRGAALRRRSNQSAEAVATPLADVPEPVAAQFETTSAPASNTPMSIAPYIRQPVLSAPVGEPISSPAGEAAKV